MMSFFTPPLTRNLVYTTPYEDFGPNTILASSEKYLKVESSELVWKPKNIANGVVELNSMGLIDGSLLPSFVNDVLSYPTSAGFPPSGESGIVYVDESTGFTYRWTGTAYFNTSTQGFYTKQDVDNLLGLKSNLSGALFTGNIDLALNNITNVGNVYSFKLSATQISDASDIIHMHLGSNTIFLDKPLNANGYAITGAASISSTSFSGTTGTFGNIYPSSTVDTLLNTKLSKSGGTMTGSILLGLNDIGSAANVYTVNLSTTTLSDSLNVLYATLTGNAIVLNKPINCGSFDITGSNVVTANNLNCTSLGCTNYYSLAGIQHFVLSGSDLVMTGRGINMNSQAITGCTAITSSAATFGSITTTGGIPTTMLGQQLMSIPNLFGLSGQYTLTVSLPIYVSSAAFINNVNVYISDDSGTVWESIPEFGFVNGSVQANWFSRYNVTNQAFSIVFFAIETFGHIADNTGRISARVSYNAL